MDKVELTADSSCVFSSAENNFAEFASSIRARRTPNAPRRRAAYPFRKGCSYRDLEREAHYYCRICAVGAIRFDDRRRALTRFHYPQLVKPERPSPTSSTRSTLNLQTPPLPMP